MTISEQLKQIISDYDAVIKVIDKDARESEDRAYGGFVRMAKGRLQEHISENIARIAWQNIGGNPDNLEINSKKVSIPMKPSYLNRIKDDEVVNHIKKNIVNYVYKLSVDKHIYVNKKFVIGIECKAFAENAMIKRILIDFDLLQTQYPNLSCYLFQLESQLGGDYSELTKPIYGSYSTRTLQSYFSCELNIITLLQGERNINRPIHKNFKSLRLEQLSDAMEILAEDMKRFH
ncbi:restriction endonuclease [Candidatus Spongiihabitans sp.]|uniref:restriction endonuclease n=1 Tax=Candidatus Spongiihabitans sp. TaxID=3101308 RepID=UPI003C7D28A6